MKRHYLALTLLLFSTASFSASNVLNDSDIPALRDALKKSYTPELCHKDLPNASVETCQCLGKAMAENLDAAKLKLCKTEGYDQCVAAEFTAAKSNLTEKQIGDCQALTKESTPATKDETTKDQPDETSSDN